VVALGPHIRQPNFEVGAEVLSEFEAAFEATGELPAGTIKRGKGNGYLIDLESLLLLQLETLGISGKLVEHGAPCTYANPEFFYSFRRDGPGRGSLGHFIGLSGKAL